jgi:hypothetical protein
MRIVKLISRDYNLPVFVSQQPCFNSGDINKGTSDDLIPPQCPGRAYWHELAVAKILKFDSGKLRAGQVTIGANRGRSESACGRIIDASVIHRRRQMAPISRTANGRPIQCLSILHGPGKSKINGGVN